ncbi:hypothetical protein LINGRAHAP2_LOCUS23507, partial [Linum grandiflorum]
TNSVDSYRSKEAHRILGFRFQAIFATIEGRRSNKWWPELVLCEARKKKITQVKRERKGINRAA